MGIWLEQASWKSLLERNLYVFPSWTYFFCFGIGKMFVSQSATVKLQHKSSWAFFREAVEPARLSWHAISSACTWHWLISAHVPSSLYLDSSKSKGKYNHLLHTLNHLCFPMEQIVTTELFLFLIRWLDITLGNIVRTKTLIRNIYAQKGNDEGVPVLHAFVELWSVTSNAEGLGHFCGCYCWTSRLVLPVKWTEQNTTKTKIDEQPKKNRQVFIQNFFY